MVQTEDSSQRALYEIKVRWNIEQWLLCLLATERAREIPTIMHIRTRTKGCVSQTMADPVGQ